MDEVAVDNPDVRFVMAHFGNPWLIDAAEVVFKNPNVWADLSGLFVGGDKEILDLLAAANKGDSAAGLIFVGLEKGDRLCRRLQQVPLRQRLAAGSDGFYRRLIEAMIPKDHHQAVFRTNAEQLFGLGG